MTRLTLGSLFDGIGGFPYAASFHGIKTLWGSEIEPFPINVTKKQFPGMEHLGDITKINGAKVEPVDIVTFGSPCQGLSVAGAMGGLDDERSGLFLEAVRVIREMRRATGGRYPRFAVWENVPGAFSTNKRQDFRAVLSQIAETEIPMPATGKWAKAGMVRTEGVDIAWRVFDAQYWGVPQRRKRIYLVADFNGQCAGEILFERQGMSGNIAEGGKAGEEVAGSVGNGVAIPINTQVATRHKKLGKNTGFGIGSNGDPVYTIQAAHSHAVLADQGGSQVSVGYGISPTLRAQEHGYQPLVMTDKDCLTPRDCQSKRIFPQNGKMSTLPAMSGGGANNQAVLVGSLVGYGEYLPGFGPLRASSGDCGSGSETLITEPLPSYWDGGQVSDTLDCSMLAKQQAMPEKRRFAGVVVPRIHENGIVPTLNTAQGGQRQPCVMAFGPGKQHNIAHAVRAQPSKADKPSSTTYVVQSATMGDSKKQNGLGVSDGPCYTLDCRADHAICYDPKDIGRRPATFINRSPIIRAGGNKVAVTLDCRNLSENKISATLQAKNTGGHSLNYQNPVYTNHAVRRLTPTECLRLQGFPDDWLADVSGYSDTAAYKAIGNSLAIPPTKWILGRIADVMRRPQRECL